MRAPTIERLAALACGLALTIALGCRAEPGDDADRLPVHPGANVIVISFDALRPDALGAYGYPLETSPQIDAFARQALLFENAWAAAPKTPTSFAAAFTGRHPTRVFHDWTLHAEQTLADVFAAAGYRTAAFANNPQLSAKRGFGRGFEHYRVYPHVADTRVLAEASRWLGRHRADQMFVWIHWIDPHSPWERRGDSEHLYQPGYSGRFEQRAAQLLALDDAAELARVRSLYDGEIHAGDRLFGALLDRLRELGLYESSILVLTSDHGEEFMEHGHLQHGWLTEENLRIPLMIRLPGQTGARRLERRVSNLDLAPSLAAMAGLDAPGDADGRSWVSASEKSQPILAVANTEDRLRAGSILVGHDKLIVHCGDRRDRELYDLGRDPGERSNLAESEAPRADALEAQLWSELGVAGCDDLAMERAAGAETRGLGRAEIEALESLGYLEPGESNR